jgi:hypothetical protein
MNDESPNDLSKLGPFGASWDKLVQSVSRIRLRGGAVGKLSSVLVVVAVAVAAIVYSVRDPWIAGIGLAGLFSLVYTLGNRMLAFAEKNPYAAMLEGADLLLHQQLQIGMKQGEFFPVDPNSLTMEPGVPVIPLDPDELNKPDQLPARSESPLENGGSSNA